MNFLICEIIRGHLNLFPKADLTKILQASLNWSCMEQYFFWQLINAHEIPTKAFIPLIPLVDPLRHPEACANLLLLLKLEKPTPELMRALLARPISCPSSVGCRDNNTGAEDKLSVTALHFWGCPDNQHSGRFAAILSAMIQTSLQAGSVVSGSAVLGGLSGTNVNPSNKEKRRSASKLVIVFLFRCYFLSAFCN
ncbi:unnamed protein product [Protopolystoma xenopodis]|uniref:Ints3-like C-terminal domain-containing protein n=1 Tax=Protopolystoma xenopodis TaxID=117903 RepID=A0A3S5C357_9PLAT|nr:unnamed protein product [Protopolystoma xenopodis]